MGLARVQAKVWPPRTLGDRQCAGYWARVGHAAAACSILEGVRSSVARRGSTASNGHRLASAEIVDDADVAAATRDRRHV